MVESDLDRPASLGVWSAERGAGAVPAREFATLREALGAAAGALGRGDARPWIVTATGAVLSPNWIEAHVGERR